MSSGPLPAALQTLEFGEALTCVAELAATPAGRAQVLGRRPSPDEAVVRARLAAADEAAGFLDARPHWGFPGVPQAGEAVRLLGVEGSVLGASELAGLGRLLAAGRVVRKEFAEGSGGPARRPEGRGRQTRRRPPPDAETCQNGSPSDAGTCQIGSPAGKNLPEWQSGGPAPATTATTGDFKALDALARRVLAHPGIESALARSVDDEGRVLDTASRELQRTRGRLAGAHNRVVAHLESLLGGIDDRHRVPEASVSIREGRYVIPLRREGRKAVGGYVHDESATGATIFVEPPSAIAMMNRVRELERAEAREVQRVLRELTDRCRPLAPALAESIEALAELDALCAVARAAKRWQGAPPEVAEGARLRIRRGRHPLLLAAGVDAVAFDLDLEGDERVVIVTGPNTGGKTVFLKSVGLIGALAQSGVIPPVGPGTRLPVFDAFFADVGDQQSIADSLSTFSAHLAGLRRIVTEAGARSLVLVDEPGAGTDPSEGEALARAVIEVLAERRVTAVVTSHLGGLKRLATPGGPVVNASLRFCGEQVAPTYQFEKGRPGRSYGLAIARGLGFPAAVIDRAEACRDRTDARVDELLRSLEVKEREAGRLVARAESERSRAGALRDALEGRAAAMAEREAAVAATEKEVVERARREARQLLLDARSEVEAAIGRLEERARAEGVKAAAREARRRVEAAARALQAGAGNGAGRRGSPRRRRRPGRRAAAAPLAEGMDVRLTDSDAEGTVVAVEGRRVVVSVRGVRMTVDRALVEPREEGS